MSFERINYDDFPEYLHWFLAFTLYFVAHGCCVDEALQGRIQEFALGGVPLHSLLPFFPLPFCSLSLLLLVGRKKIRGLDAEN